MSLGIKLPSLEDGSDEGFWIYFDAVSTYTKNIRGQVTKNPTARAGKVVTDHFVKENPTFGFTGIISYVDIYNAQFLVLDGDLSSPNNARLSEISPVRIQDSSNKLLNFLPESISQFLPLSNSSITMDQIGNNYKDYVTTCLERLMSGEYVDPKTQRTQTKIRTIRLYEFIGLELDKIIDDLCLVGINIAESPDTGNALICDLQFEQVKFVKLRTAALSPDVVKAMKPKAAPKAKKGSVDSTVNKADSNKIDEVTVDEKDKLIKAAETGGKE
jgi:hypothetical protein